MAKARKLPSGKFANLPIRAVHLLAAGDIDSEDVALLAALSGYANALGADGWPAHATLAACVRRSRSWVCKRLGRLADLGLVESIARKREDGGRTTNAHRILFDAPIADDLAESGTGGNPLGDNASKPKSGDTGTGSVPSKEEQGPSSAPLRGASDSDTDLDRPTDTPAHEGGTELTEAGRSVVDGALRPEIQIPPELADLHPDRLARIRAALAKASNEQRQRFSDVVATQAANARHLGRWAESMADKAQNGILDPDDAAEAARMRAKREAEETARRQRESAEEAARIDADPVTPALFKSAMPESLARLEN